MKKGLYISLLCVLLSILLTGCVRLTIDPSPQELMGFQEDVLAAYDEAARLYDWFDLAPMPVDESDSVREGETTYFRVRDDGIASTEDLRSRLEEAFIPELAEEIFNKSPDQYRDFDGKLYAAPGGRGTNIYFQDKTVQAERLSEDRWAVTLTFWADFEDSHMVPEPGTDFSESYPIATAGYSTTTIYYERTPKGWRFTSFCPSDGLDLEAETVYTFDYAQGLREDCSDWEMICYLLHADGGFAEGAFYRLYQRFLERPGDILSSLALLDTAPYGASRLNSLIAGPGYEATYEDEAGRLAFEEAVRRCAPANEAERAVLMKIQGAYDSLLRQEQAWTDLRNLRFSFTVPNTAVFTLGPQEGAFPWGVALDVEPVLVSPAMDGFGPCYEAALDAVTLKYTVNPDDGTEVLYKMTTNDAEAVTAINRMLGRDESVTELLSVSNPFSDLSESHWAYMNVLEAAGELKDHSSVPGTQEISVPENTSAYYFSSATDGWAVSEGQLFHTTDSGKNWDKVGKPYTYAVSGLFFFSDQEGVLLGKSEETSCILLKTSDGGETWNDLLAIPATKANYLPVEQFPTEKSLMESIVSAELRPASKTAVYLTIRYCPYESIHMYDFEVTRQAVITDSK